jgi:hypothetical protein
MSGTSTGLGDERQKELERVRDQGSWFLQLVPICGYGKLHGGFGVDHISSPFGILFSAIEQCSEREMLPKIKKQKNGK